MLLPGLGETFDTGRDTGVPVIDYADGSTFNGSINRISVRPKR